jgi:hypothetical protein
LINDKGKLKRLLFNLKPNEGKFKLLKSNDNIMAYSKITIDFVAVPQQGTILSFTEKPKHFFIRDFQKKQAWFSASTIPVNSSTNYEMTTFDNVDTSNIDVEFTPGLGTVRVALGSVLVDENLDGTITYRISSTTLCFLLMF